MEEIDKLLFTKEFPSIEDVDQMEVENSLPKDEDDEVLLEIPLLLNQQLKDNIALFQYPLRPSWRPYDPTLLHQMKMKPKQQKGSKTFFGN